MLQIRCTKKLLDALGIKQKDIGSIKGADSLLGNWYANLFSADRRKILVFMNEKTLLSFVLVGIKKDNIKKNMEMFYRGLEQVFTLEGIDGEKIEEVFAEYEDVEFTKTESRSVLGNLNELVSLYKHHIYHNEGLQYCDMTAVIQQINHMPQRNIDWKYSVEALSELLALERVPNTIKPDIVKDGSDGFYSKCLACHKSRPGIVDKKCDFCRDSGFHEAILCDLNRSVQGSEAFECHAFRPMLKLAGSDDLSLRETVPEAEEEKLPESESFKYKKAHALQRLQRNPDEEIAWLKYHVAWNTAQRKPFFREIGKDEGKINLIIEDAGAPSDVVTSIMFLAADHVHIYLESDGEKSADTLIREIKAYCQRRLLSEFGKLFNKEKNLWDEGYFVETLG